MKSRKSGNQKWVLLLAFSTIVFILVFVTRRDIVSNQMHSLCMTMSNRDYSNDDNGTTSGEHGDAHDDADDLVHLKREEYDEVLNREKVLKASLSALEKEKISTENDHRTLEGKIEQLQKEKDEMHQSLEEREKEMTSKFEEGLTEGKRGYMKSVMEADVSLLRSILKKYKKSMDDDWEAMVSKQAKRGILVVAGEPKYMLNAFISLWPVRHYWNSSLPISVFFWGKTENVSSETKDFFETHIGDVSFVDLANVQWPAHQRDLFLRNQESGRLGWVLKLVAAYFAPYQEILYLDADSSPLADPDTMFSMEEYKKTGTLFWPDTPCSRPGLFEQLIDMNLIDEKDAPRVDEHESESGQWLLNRRIHREPLEYTIAMGSHSDFTFSHAFGDKDLFRAGFALAGDAKKYSLIPTTLGFAWSAAAHQEGDNNNNNNQEGERTMRGYIQFSSHGEPLFHHRAGWKTKYEFDEHEERDLDSISSPLSCEWLRNHWPMEYPGVMSQDKLNPIQKNTCTYSIASFGKAVKKCGSEFTGKPDERVPIFNIKGSHIERVHQAMQTAWKKALDAQQKSNNAAFSIQISSS